MASKPNSQKGGGSGTGGGSNGSRGNSGNGSARPGSWIIKHDPNGVPYWTNDVSGEATYHLFTPHVGMGPPMRHVGSDQPYCLYLPITPQPSPTAGKRGGDNDNNNNNNNNKNNKNNNNSNNNKNSKNNNSNKKHNNNDSNNNNNDDDDDDGDGGRHDAARSGGKNKATKSKKGNASGGSWEEKYHPVTGAKSWYHTGTKKNTTKDPLF